MKQEQFPPAPGVARLAPGVMRIQLPIRFTGLGHVSMYLLEDADGAAVIDPGLPGRTSWSVIRSGLREAGLAPALVHTVIVTHSHPDHFGGVARILRASGGRMLAHEAYRTWWKPHGHLDADLSDEERRVEDGARRGVHPWSDPGRKRGIRSRVRSVGPTSLALGAVRSPAPTVRVVDSQELTLAGRTWVAVHTPGHTGDHLCLYDPNYGILVSGDHVLPTITPHVGAVGAGLDPLGAYLESLDKVDKLPDVRQVLPAHGEPFGDLAGRTETIRRHHDLRLDQIRTTLGQGEATTATVAAAIYPPRLWGFLAESETYAHLVHLERNGEIARSVGDGPPRFRLVT